MRSDLPIRRDDLLSVAEEFGIKKPERDIDRVREALNAWEGLAGARDVPGESVRAIRRELDVRAEEIGG